jgi:hypothetical protein
MPKHSIYVLENAHSTEGQFQEWDLPWERLVYDQRIDYPSGEEAQVYRVMRVVERIDGSYSEVVLDPGNQDGGDPKKPRPPYRD